MTDDEFYEALQEFVGRQVGPPAVGPDHVNAPMIRHWCDAIGDENPVYLDDTAARESVHGQLVAPPTMLQAWVMPSVKSSGRDPNSVYEQMNQLLFSRGFTSVVATNSEQTYHRYLHVGDEISVTTVIESISPEKTTGLGAGHFVTTRQDYLDADGEVVGSMMFRIIRFRPPAKPAPARPKRPEASTTHDNAWWFDALQAGELRVQRCADCSTLRHPPGPMCPTCSSLRWDSVAAPASGTIHSLAVVHYPVVPSFEYPLPVVLVDVDGPDGTAGTAGIRMIMNTADSEPASVVIGARVRIEVRDADDPSIDGAARLPFAIVENPS